MANETENVAMQAALRGLLAWILLPLFFLIVGGSFSWWEAWAYCIVLLLPMTVFGVWMIKRDPEFLARRFQMREKEETQRRVQIFAMIPFLGTMIVPGIDFRLQWSSPPLVVTVGAQTVVFLSYLWIIWVFLTNRWAGRTVETWAAQKVISSGPYAVVRHPMYSGMIAMQLATSLALGSWWGLIPAAAIIPLFVFRIGNEENVLVNELTGYKAYQGKVRFKLIPFIW